MDSELFESPFAAYWTEESYAATVLGAARVGYRIDAIDAGNAILYSGPRTQRVVPIASVVLVLNTAASPRHKFNALAHVLVARGSDALMMLRNHFSEAPHSN